jgi:Ty3 transposon capsid-like protein/Zinc knuckle
LLYQREEQTSETKTDKNQNAVEVKDPISTKNKDKTWSPRETRRDSDSSNNSTVSPTIPGIEELKEELAATQITRLPNQHFFEDIDTPMEAPMQPTNFLGETIATIDTDTSKAREVKLNPPKPFTGKREDLKKFLQDTSLYILVNDKIYDTDVKKIAFTLSFMNEGDAASWKEQLLEDAMALPSLDLGTWKRFKDNLEEAFKPYDAPGDALEEMKTLRMGNNSIEEHIAKFKMLVTRSGLEATSAAVIDYFRESLNIPLQRRILSLENPPKTLKEWYDWAAKLDNNFRRMQRILGRNDRAKTGSEKKKVEPKRQWNIPRRDPDAMDVDTLTAEKREEMMKKGLCFGCGKPGHISKNCPDKDATRKKMNGKELLAHIRSLTMHMDDDEKEKFYDEAEKEGF